MFGLWRRLLTLAMKLSARVVPSPVLPLNFQMACIRSAPSASSLSSRDVSVLPVHAVGQCDASRTAVRIAPPEASGSDGNRLERVAAHSRRSHRRCTV